jgi:hypothetical protein
VVANKDVEVFLPVVKAELNTCVGQVGRLINAMDGSGAEP